MGNVTPFVPAPPDDLVPDEERELLAFCRVGGLALDEEERELWHEFADDLVKHARPVSVEARADMRLLLAMSRVHQALRTAAQMADPDRRGELRDGLNDLERDVFWAKIRLGADIGLSVFQEILSDPRLGGGRDEEGLDA
jgi:hypothetical protein